MASLSPGFYPFWFWNDTLTADEICWQIAEMAAQGVRGFFIHSRQGLGQPYLSVAFFEMVDVAIAAAKEHGMRVHRYDEYPYPSGVAGGEVVASPRSQTRDPSIGETGTRAMCKPYCCRDKCGCSYLMRMTFPIAAYFAFRDTMFPAPDHDSFANSL